MVKILDAMCQRYRCRPSEVIGIENELESFDFDCTVMLISENETVPNIKEDELARVKQQFEYVKMLQQKVSHN